MSTVIHRGLFTSDVDKWPLGIFFASERGGDEGRMRHLGEAVDLAEDKFHLDAGDLVHRPRW